VRGPYVRPLSFRTRGDAFRSAGRPRAGVYLSGPCPEGSVPAFLMWSGRVEVGSPRRKRLRRCPCFRIWFALACSPCGPIPGF